MAIEVQLTLIIVAGVVAVAVFGGGFRIVFGNGNDRTGRAALKAGSIEGSLAVDGVDDVDVAEPDA